MNSQSQHIPVLQREAVAALHIRPNGTYVDGTFGRGGHSLSILKELSEHGTLIVFDRDPEAIERAHRLFADDPRVRIIHAPFADMRNLLELDGQVDGVLLDIGVSSPQIDQAERGFSFQRDGNLDMRMDTRDGETAAQWLARVDEADLVHVLFRLGEEKFARRIAKAIVEARQLKPITRTLELAEIIAAATPKKDKFKHPATRTFQAIRLHINQELSQLTEVLPEAVQLLATAGRLVVISFHSLEDRIVKRFMRAYSSPFLPPKHVPTTDIDYSVPLRMLGRATKPSDEEVAQNPRSRSSVMRVAERTDLAREALVRWENAYAA